MTNLLNFRLQKNHDCTFIPIGDEDREEEEEEEEEEKADGVSEGGEGREAKGT